MTQLSSVHIFCQLFEIDWFVIYLESCDLFVLYSFYSFSMYNKFIRTWSYFFNILTYNKHLYNKTLKMILKWLRVVNSQHK